MTYNYQNIPDGSKAGTIAGHKVQAAIYKNSRHAQNDDFAVMPVDETIKTEMLDILKKMIVYAQDNLIAHDIRDNIKGKKKIASCTATLVGYDPEKYTLDVASFDDSPAFVILDDGEKIEAVMITAPVGHYLSGIENSVNGRIELVCRLNRTAIMFRIGNFPSIDEYEEIKEKMNCDDTKAAFEALKENSFIQQGSYRFKGRERKRGTINLNELKYEAAEHYGMNKDKIKMHLLVASDGILYISTTKLDSDRSAEAEVISNYPTFDLATSEYVLKEGGNSQCPTPDRLAENTIKALYEIAKTRSQTNDNVADIMAKLRKKNAIKDNATAIFIANLEQGKGERIIASVCDTAGSEPKPVAQIAIESFKKSLELMKTKQPLNPPNYERMIQPRTNEQGNSR